MAWGEELSQILPCLEFSWRDSDFQELIMGKPLESVFCWL